MQWTKEVAVDPIRDDVERSREDRRDRINTRIRDGDATVDTGEGRPDVGEKQLVEAVAGRSEVGVEGPDGDRCLACAECPERQHWRGEPLGVDDIGISEKPGDLRLYPQPDRGTRKRSVDIDRNQTSDSLDPVAALGFDCRVVGSRVAVELPRDHGHLVSEARELAGEKVDVFGHATEERICVLGDHGDLHDAGSHGRRHRQLSRRLAR